MRKSFKFKLYSADRNKRLDRQRIAASRIYNHCIALHKHYYRMWGKHLSTSRLKKRIAFMRKHFRSDWRCLGSQSVQDAIERIEGGFQRFFENIIKKKAVKSTRRVSPPSFRKSIKYRSFTLKQAGWKLKGEGYIQIGKCTYRFHQSRPIDGSIKTVTICKDAVGDFWIIFPVKLAESVENRTVTGKTAGFDFGLTTFLMRDDGTKIQAPQPLFQALKALRKASRRLSRKKKGSSGRKRARLALARLHRRIANIRRDWQFKIALELARTLDVICIEDLGLQGMKALWGRKVSDLAWADFVKILTWQCKKHGSTLVKVDRFFPSSKLCSQCGHIHKELELTDRQWGCPSCGTHHDRDKNAAVMIKREGLRLYALEHANSRRLSEAGGRLREKAA
jgi:putative transposase